MDDELLGPVKKALERSLEACSVNFFLLKEKEVDKSKHLFTKIRVSKRSIITYILLVKKKRLRIMAKNKKNIKDSAIKDFAKENERMRNERIAGTNNGMKLRTRSIPNKKKYTRKQKHSNKDFE